MAACDGLSRRGPRRAGERGATLTLLAVIFGFLLLGLGTIFLDSAAAANRHAILREREAALFAAADSGLTLALEGLRADPARRLAMSFERGGVRVEVTSEPGLTTRVTVTASSGAGDLFLKRALTGDVDVSAHGEPRFLRVRRE